MYTLKIDAGCKVGSRQTHASLVDMFSRVNTIKQGRQYDYKEIGERLPYVDAKTTSTLNIVETTKDTWSPSAAFWSINNYLVVRALRTYADSTNPICILVGKEIDF